MQLVGILDDFVLSRFCFSAGFCFGEINIFAVRAFDDKVCGAIIATFVIGAGDVTAWTWECQCSTLWAKHTYSPVNTLLSLLAEPGLEILFLGVNKRVQQCLGIKRKGRDEDRNTLG